MTDRSRRELERAIERLEASTPSGGEYDPPDLTLDEKHALDELFDADPWDPDPDARAVFEDLHDRHDGDTDW